MGSQNWPKLQTGHTDDYYTWQSDLSSDIWRVIFMIMLSKQPKYQDYINKSNLWIAKTQHDVLHSE